MGQTIVGEDFLTELHDLYTTHLEPEVKIKEQKVNINVY